jgi:hypothetical protein
MCPEPKEGKSLIGAEYRGKSFYIKVNAVALYNAPERRIRASAITFLTSNYT